MLRVYEIIHVIEMLIMLSLEASMCVEVVSCQQHCYIPLHIRSKNYLFPLVLLGTSIIIFPC
jgi:hypothetical protein